MPALTVIAKPKAKPGSEDALGDLLEGLVAPTRAERGCIACDLHRSHDDPGLFMFTESRESRPLWEDHTTSSRLKAFGAKQGDVTDRWEPFTGEKL